MQRCWPLLHKPKMTGFEPIIAKNVQKINFKFTMISIFTTLILGWNWTFIGPILIELCFVLVGL